MSATATVRQITYGETVTQGMPVYLKAADGLYWKADSDASSAAAAAVGIALTPGTAGETGLIVTAGEMDVGATLAVGTTYVVSNTAGKICPIADLSTGEYNTILGTATAADKLYVNVFASGVAWP
jgi:hypothetical protein